MTPTIIFFAYTPFLVTIVFLLFLFRDRKIVTPKRQIWTGLILFLYFIFTWLLFTFFYNDFDTGEYNNPFGILGFSGVLFVVPVSLVVLAQGLIHRYGWWIVLFFIFLLMISPLLVQYAILLLDK